MQGVDLTKIGQLCPSEKDTSKFTIFRKAEFDWIKAERKFKLSL